MVRSPGCGARRGSPGLHYYVERRTAVIDRSSSGQAVEAVGEVGAFDVIAGEQHRLLVGEPGLGDAAESAQELRPRGRQVVVSGQLRLGGQLVERGQSGVWSMGLAYGDCPVEGDDRGWPD